MRNTNKNDLFQLLLAVVIGVALLLATAPLLLLALIELTAVQVVLICVNFFGWALFARVLMVVRTTLSQLEQGYKLVGIGHEGTTPLTALSHYLKESRRWFLIAEGVRFERNLAPHDLVVNLRKICESAYRELNAKAVQLTLSDESSGLSTQSMLIGEPLATTSQEMVLQLGDRAEEEYRSQPRELLRAPVTFAGTLFGTLYVQLPQGVVASESDRLVLSGLATQGALLLVDARFTDELLRMRRASEESVRAKTGFLANLSHELRGPLGIILNGVELVLDNLCGPTTESQRDTLTMIRNNGNHLVDLVNDVLDYAKVEAGKVVAKPVALGVKQLLDDLATVVRSQALAKKHQLIVEQIDPQLAIKCDKRHARQMLINFLTNAIKYTPDGGKITLRAERGAENRVKISVTDTGIGIPKDQRSKVFSAFERVDNRYALSQVGTGLGMPLTKRLAEVNGGIADFESEEGRGSTFWLALPVAEIKEVATSDSDDAGRATALAQAQGQGEQILLVDHDRETREMLSRYLGHQGFSILEAQSGRDVAQIIRSKEVRLVVVENDMPDLSGEEMVAIIRGFAKTATVPIILLSSRAFVFDIERFLKLGVDRCLSKPVELSDLAVTARQLIDEAPAQQL